jgi:hypothetical protein
MSKYYFNENPQVTQWREKYEKLEEELDCAIDQLSTMACCKVYTEERLQALKDKIMNFNRLPWYKKMFFKFEV